MPEARRGHRELTVTSVASFGATPQGTVTRLRWRSWHPSVAVGACAKDMVRQVMRSLSCRRSPADESVHMGERFFIRAVITLLYFINTLRVGAVGAGARHARTTAYNAAAASLA